MVLGLGGLVSGLAGGGPTATIIDNNKLKSIDFGTVVDMLAEGQIEGSASASKAGITDKTSAAYKNAFLKDLFLNRPLFYRLMLVIQAPIHQNLIIKKIY